jgi:hypothetical protein
MILAISLITGLTGWASVNADDDIFTGIGIDADSDDIAGLTVGWLSGFLLSSILMNVVSSAVKTVIICFAEAPEAFSQIHPELSKDMLSAWVQAYPTECSDELGKYIPQQEQGVDMV